MIKPQFEAGRNDIGKGGIVRDSDVHHRVLLDIPKFATDLGFDIVDIIRSPITGQKGNVEYLMWLSWGNHVQGLQSLQEKVSLIVDDES